MFRRDPVAVQEWSPEHVETCAVRQLAILSSAAQCVREGGILVYSTCTFSTEENESVVQKFLESHPEFVLEKRMSHLVAPGLWRRRCAAFSRGRG